MKKIYILTITALLLSSPVFGDSFVLSPSIQNVGGNCTIYLSASELQEAKGIGIEILFDQTVLSCNSCNFSPASFEEFSRFHQIVNNDSGLVETVLLKQSPGGFSGSADSILVLHFETVDVGTTEVLINKSYLDGSPMLVDASNTSIAAEIDTAVVVVSSVTDAEDPEVPITAANLYQNYPNPFNPSTTIRFDVPQRAPVSLKIYDVNGRLINTVIDNKFYERGSWKVQWNGINDRGIAVPSGLYFCSYKTSGYRETKKVILLR